ncbi:MAG: hypothetical protein J4F99_04075, partial [Acidimicrobiia bacterium]|nr:hypothetical protein [Acidimicrobiia bacterium]
MEGIDMFKTRKSARIGFSLLAALLSVILLAAACGEAEEDDAGPAPPPSGDTAAPEAAEPDDGEESPPPPATMDYLGDGSLGVVAVEAGDAIQIRSLNAISGDVAFFGLPIERAVVLA